MDLFTYQKATNRTMNNNLSTPNRLGMLGMGLSGEAGEVTDLLKKHLYHGHELDKHDVEEELGDVMWYISNLATELGLSLEVILEQNIEKLKTRYPKGFSVEDSIKRVDQ